MSKKKIAVVGIGKIAQDQHLPVIDKSGAFELAACVSTRGVGHRDVPVFRSQAELFASMPEVGIVSICTPPAVRHAYVREAIDAGKDVLLEKPPTPTISEFEDLVSYGAAKGRVLFQTWHSRFNAAVDATRDILAAEGVASLRIDWRESVRKWHPGQDWVWEPGGFGVCDPGINALSILTAILPFPVFVESATLAFPANRQTPVDAQIAFKTSEAHRPRISAGFNWLETSGEVWTMTIETRSGKALRLEKGSTVLVVDGQTRVARASEEYEAIYERFAGLLDARRSEMDGGPLRLVADAFFIGRRVTAEPFEW